MKKKLQVAFALATLTGSMYAQLPVSTAPQNKSIYMEEFTGIHCGYCPDGHRIATQIHDANPGKAVLVNIHSGGYAVPSSATDLDFRTPEGTAIDGMSGMGITGYPAGDVNRRVFSGSAMATGRGSWTSMANTIKSQAAYCNVACEGSIDPQTRVLTVKVEVYYTANSPVATNSLNVFLLESKIAGYQSNYGSPLYNITNYNADGSYNHNHVLRKALTPTFGMAISNTSSGSMFTTTLTYTIPASYGSSGHSTVPNFENMELAAFVAETDREVINAAAGPITLTQDIKAISASLPPIVCNANFAPEVVIKNNGTSAITTLTITPSIDAVAQAATPWTGNLAPGASATVVLNNISTAVGGGHALTCVITGDSYTQNNTAKASFYAASNYQGTPIAEGFVLGAFPPPSWSISNPDNGPTWSRKSTAGSGGYALTSQSAKYDFYSNPVIGDRDELYLPPMDLTGSADPEMSFDLSYSQRDDNSDDAIEIYASSDCGDHWSLMYHSNGVAMATRPADASPYTPANADAGSWKTEIITLPGFNLPNVLVKFVAINDNGNNLYLDNINLEQKSPTGINAVSATQVNVSVYPNPTNGLANVTINSRQASEAKISVVNQLGQVVDTKTVGLSEGRNTVELNTKGYAAGIYNISVNTSNGSTVKRLNVVK